MLEIVDLQGRQVARLRPAGAERWIWNPEASLREGIYYARAAGLAQKIILLR